MYLYICIYIYIHILKKKKETNIHIYIHTYICIYICTFTFMCVWRRGKGSFDKPYIHFDKCDSYIYILHTYLYFFSHTCIFMHVCVGGTRGASRSFIYTYTTSCIHIYTTSFIHIDVHWFVYPCISCTCIHIYMTGTIYSCMCVWVGQRELQAALHIFIRQASYIFMQIDSCLCLYSDVSCTCIHMYMTSTIYLYDKLIHMYIHAFIFVFISIHIYVRVFIFEFIYNVYVYM